MNNVLLNMKTLSLRSVDDSVKNPFLTKLSRSFVTDFSYQPIFMQLISNGDNLYQMSNQVFWGKQEKVSLIYSLLNYPRVAQEL